MDDVAFVGTATLSFSVFLCCLLTHFCSSSFLLHYRRRYIYLWIYYAVYEELAMDDLERASQVFEACLSVIPHKQFSFSKIWIMAAKLFVRREDLVSARKLLGKAIGLCGKEKIFIEYIALELALDEVDRCRSLYTNYLKAMPHNCKAWSKYAELENSVGETEVRRATTRGMHCLVSLQICWNALCFLQHCWFSSSLVAVVVRTPSSFLLLQISHPNQTFIPTGHIVLQRCRAIYELAVGQPSLDMPEMVWKGYIDFEIEEGDPFSSVQFRSIHLVSLAENLWLRYRRNYVTKRI